MRKSVPSGTGTEKMKEEMGAGVGASPSRCARVSGGLVHALVGACLTAKAVSTNGDCKEGKGTYGGRRKLWGRGIN